MPRMYGEIRHTVVVVPNLVLVLALGVDDDFGEEDGQDVFEEFHGKVELGPVVARLEDIQHVV